ncbi:MAG: circadian clock KaiB family protein [Eubacteriales bacterium]
MMESKFILKLYITGHTPASERAVANLHKICEREFGEVCRVTIIDVLEYPQLAEDEKILATPTLIKKLPPPCKRVIGDLSDEDNFFSRLDLKSFKSKQGE